MTVFDILKEVGGVAGLVALVLFVVKALTDNKNALTKIASEALAAKAQIEKDALLAKAQVDNEALMAKAQAKKIAAETDEVIAAASAAMVTGMQFRVDALIKRVETSEHMREEQDAEIARLKKRIDALENLLIKKDGDIRSRDERIKELECKVADQAQEIAQLQEQVSALELKASKKPAKKIDE